ncbi:hypothetical protein [Actinacidiphila sp. bgisy160]|uniref:hypothetical protein n=1 Tax=Actinacidiphila sp. bgisy160 TaxID=3413796 RepID=UPI003D74C832
MKHVRIPECSPWEDTGRIDHIARLAAEGDLTELAEALLQPAEGWDEGYGAVSRLRAMPQERRMALAALLVEQRKASHQVPDKTVRVWLVLAAVSPGFAEDSWCAQWNGMLERHAADFWWSQTSDDMPTLAEALLDAGRPLSGEVVGLLRRSALMGLGWAQLLLDRIPEPPLNPGELWTDRVLAELPELGDPWRRLIPHLRAAGPNPSARWDRAAAAVLDGIDPEAVRRTATPWLALATHGSRDPWNVTAVRGLAWLLSSPSVPPHLETIRVLGALVERPPVKTVVAAAGIRALARLDGGAARDELRRLAGCVDHTVTRKQIHRVLTP